MQGSKEQKDFASHKLLKHIRIPCGKKSFQKEKQQVLLEKYLTEEILYFSQIYLTNSDYFASDNKSYFDNISARANFPACHVFLIWSKIRRF